MRIISGKYKGRKLYTATRHIRPTTDRIKEHIFAILQDYVDDRSVIDLFAGSGSLGIESLSRGASQVTFVEKSFQSIQVLKKNLDRLDIHSDYSIVHSDVLAFLRMNTQPADFIFADPPFKWNQLNELIELVFKHNNLCEDGIFILESEKSHRVKWDLPQCEIIKQTQFDRSIITFFGWRKEHEK